MTACRLIASKRVELAIDAVRLAGRPRCAWSWSATAPSAPRSRDAPSDLGPTVTFTGALPRREALAWMAAADVLLHPSAVEAAPTVVREARALGVPVVACDAGDIAAWAHDDPGIRVAAPTAEALASALESR